MMKHIYPAALAAAFLLVLGAASLQSSPGTAARITMATTTIAAPLATTASSAAGAPAPASYAPAQVALHNSQSSCWTIINGSVYDLTSFIHQHPGGEGAILSICGIDGTSAFEGQHSGNRKANSELARLEIGTLSQ